MSGRIRGLIRRRRWRTITAFAISITPTSGLRKVFMKILLGYHIGRNTKIAFGVFFNVDTALIGSNVTLSRWNAFYGPVQIEIGHGTFFGQKNQIMCGWATTDNWAEDRMYGRRLTVGDRCLINEGHLFDIVGSIDIGDGTWVAGFRSQLMTHGASVKDRDITIGKNCFLGSAVLIAPGSAIGDDNIVAMGALVTRKIPGNNVIIGGVPAKVLRERKPDDEHSFVKEWS